MKIKELIHNLSNVPEYLGDLEVIMESKYIGIDKVDRAIVVEEEVAGQRQRYVVLVPYDTDLNNVEWRAEVFK